MSIEVGDRVWIMESPGRDQTLALKTAIVYEDCRFGQVAVKVEDEYETRALLCVKHLRVMPKEPSHG